MTSSIGELKEIIRNSGLVDYDISEDRLSEMANNFYMHDNYDEDYHEEEDEEDYNF